MPSRALSAIYDCYMALRSLGEPGGKLLFLTGLDDKGTAATIAGNIAGAATLILEPDPATAQAAIRNSVCDFSVNSLDESLRILKNEIRKKQTVSVCLVAEVEPVTAEMIERGVQPDIVTADNPGGFTGRGAVGIPELPAQPPSVRLAVPAHLARAWQSLDRMAAASLEEQDPATAPRRRWLRLAPRYLGRARGGERFLRMNDAEWARFLTVLRSASSELPPELTVERSAELISIR